MSASNYNADLQARKNAAAQFGYMSPVLSNVEESIPLHHDQDESLDAITYEIIRSKLGNINIDHGETIRRISGSMPVAEGNDYNASIATELGEGTAFGAHNWFFAGYADLAIRWVLEFRANSVGVNDGDVFIHNDPWVGTNHQNDAAVMAPVFWDGKLFAWIYNSAHQQDMGGPTPGSMTPLARTVFEESDCIPPVKIVDRGVLRDDIMDFWTRRTRAPATSSLEVKSQLAGAKLARDRLLEVISRYGPAKVKRAMYKTITDAAEMVGQRLQSIPDGVWADERYIGVTGPDNWTTAYRLCIQFEKRGDRLRITNRGSSPSGPGVNFTAGAFRGCVLNGLFHILGFDIDLCGAGLLRQLDFELTPGLVNSATYPTAVSSSAGTMSTVVQSFCLASKMVSGVPSLASHSAASNSLHTMSAAFSMDGLDRFGNFFKTTILDLMAGGSGAYSDHDAIDHAGSSTGINHPIPDIELVERRLPVLALFRREDHSTSGQGRYRGSPALISAYIGHGSNSIEGSGNGVSSALPLGTGLDGAPPSTAGGVFITRDTRCKTALANGKVPASLADLEGAGADFENASSVSMPFGHDDVALVVSNAGAGFGDPLERDAEAVALDVASGRLSADDAARKYGVVVGEDGALAADATEHARRTIKDERAARSRAPRHPVSGTSDQNAAGTRLVLNSVGMTDHHLFCRKCGQNLAAREGQYRLGCKELDQPLDECIAHYSRYRFQSKDEFVVRTYICPNCSGSLDSHICKKEDHPYEDFRFLT
jgi:N-methylhydantoinase B/acetone carboxylase, alpha subunit